MIVDTMIFDEITEYLLKTSFSKERLVEICKKYIIPKRKEYRREIIKWRQNPNRTEYKIFKPIITKGRYDEEQVFIPYAINTEIPEVRSMLLSRWLKRG